MFFVMLTSCFEETLGPPEDRGLSPVTRGTNHGIRGELSVPLLLTSGEDLRGGQEIEFSHQKPMIEAFRETGSLRRQGRSTIPPPY